MQAVILAAGLGTRMGALTKDTPKPMLKIEDQTLLERNIAALPAAVDEVVIVVGYLGEKIREFFGDHSNGKKMTYVTQRELKGTGHALMQCRDALHGRFLVIMGDDLYAKDDLERLAAEPLGVLVLELGNDDAEGNRHAIVTVDSMGQVVDIIERQPGIRGVLVNTGAYVLDMRYFDCPLVPAGNLTEEFGLPQTLLQLVRSGAKMSVVKATWWHKVGAPEDLKLVSSK
jgi:UDP-N-acetylglucosamine diphosphorylase / glucose-1-phosphate thymidylyltransferase / UDP-N-acetylgalactosamine diphosphorylase / glucosamine-1-phosphate N-acetyltransferase / galactosamine-1-phosphate N-acetyltransferase